MAKGNHHHPQHQHHHHHHNEEAFGMTCYRWREREGQSRSQLARDTDNCEHLRRDMANTERYRHQREVRTECTSTDKIHSLSSSKHLKGQLGPLDSDDKCLFVTKKQHFLKLCPEDQVGPPRAEKRSMLRMLTKIILISSPTNCANQRALTFTF